MFLKNLKFIGLLLSATLLFNACDEVGPAVNLQPKVEDYFFADQVEAKQDRRVILEEFTGVKCTNCPDGHDKVKELFDQYGERFTSVAMHAGGLAGFIEGHSVQNMMTDEGTQLHIEFGNSGQPSAIIDRVQYENENNFFIYSRVAWGLKVEERMEVPSECNITINPVMVESSDSLGIEVTIHYTEDLPEDHYITVGVLENKIIDAQKQQDDSIIDDYEHNHVMRKMITGFNGDLLIGQDFPKSPGLTVVRNFGLAEIPEEWNRDNLELYAFVHRRGDVKNVLQSAVVHWP